MKTICFVIGLLLAVGSVGNMDVDRFTVVYNTVQALLGIALIVISILLDMMQEGGEKNV